MKPAAVDRPIIFSGPMIRALLAGSKTMTRRRALRPGGWPSLWQRVKPGDRLWVRESFCPCVDEDGALIVGARVLFGADPDARDPGKWAAGQVAAFRPSIHMPRWASRLTLIVTATKIERLQEISEADARAEGVLWVPGHGEITPADLHEGYSNYLNCREGFAVLWESIHGSGSWEANPEVVALTFRVVKQNIDKVTA